MADDKKPTEDSPAPLPPVKKTTGRKSNIKWVPMGIYSRPQPQPQPQAVPNDTAPTETKGTAMTLPVRAAADKDKAASEERPDDKETKVEGPKGGEEERTGDKKD